MITQEVGKPFWRWACKGWSEEWIYLFYFIFFIFISADFNLEFSYFENAFSNPIFNSGLFNFEFF